MPPPVVAPSAFAVEVPVHAPPAPPEIEANAHDRAPPHAGPPTAFELPEPSIAPELGPENAPPSSPFAAIAGDDPFVDLLSPQHDPDATQIRSQPRPQRIVHDDLHPEMFADDETGDLTIGAPESTRPLELQPDDADDNVDLFAELDAQHDAPPPAFTAPDPDTVPRLDLDPSLGGAPTDTGFDDDDLGFDDDGFGSDGLDDGFGDDLDDDLFGDDSFGEPGLPGLPAQLPEAFPVPIARSTPDSVAGADPASFEGLFAGENRGEPDSADPYSDFFGEQNADFAYSDPVVFRPDSAPAPPEPDPTPEPAATPEPPAPQPVPAAPLPPTPVNTASQREEVQDPPFFSDVDDGLDFGGDSSGPLDFGDAGDPLDFGDFDLNWDDPVAADSPAPPPAVDPSPLAPAGEETTGLAEAGIDLDAYAALFGDDLDDESEDEADAELSAGDPSWSADPLPPHDSSDVMGDDALAADTTEHAPMTQEQAFLAPSPVAAEAGDAEPGLDLGAYEALFGGDDDPSVELDADDPYSDLFAAPEPGPVAVDDTPDAFDPTAFESVFAAPDGVPSPISTSGDLFDDGRPYELPETDDPTDDAAAGLTFRDWEDHGADDIFPQLGGTPGEEAAPAEDFDFGLATSEVFKTPLKDPTVPVIPDLSEEPPPFSAEGLSPDAWFAGSDEPAEPPAPAPAAAQLAVPSEAFLLRQDGELFSVPDLATLQRWIIERRIDPDADLSDGNDGWKRIGASPELSVFFAAVAQLEQPASGPNEPDDDSVDAEAMASLFASPEAAALAMGPDDDDEIPDFSFGMDDAPGPPARPENTLPSVPELTEEAEPLEDDPEPLPAGEYQDFGGAVEVEQLGDDYRNSGGPIWPRALAGVALVALLVWFFLPPSTPPDDATLSLAHDAQQPQHPPTEVIPLPLPEPEPEVIPEPEPEVKQPKVAASPKPTAAKPKPKPKPVAAKPKPKPVAPKPEAPERVAAPRKEQQQFKSLVQEGWRKAEDDAEAAIGLFALATKLRPDDTIANYGMGYALLQKGDSPAAANMYLCRALRGAGAQDTREINAILNNSAMTCR